MIDDYYPSGTWSGDPNAPWNEEQPAETEIIDPEADAEDIKNLAVAQALFKAIKAEVGTGNEFNLRGRVDAIMRERFNEAKKLGFAPKSFDVEINDQKVGTYSITTTEAKPAETTVKLNVENSQELLSWAVEHGCVVADMKAVERHFSVTGEVPDGCVAVPVTMPEVVPGLISRTTLRIDPTKVANALGDELEEAVRPLLEGGK